MKLLYIDESHDKKNYTLCGFLSNDINYRKLNDEFNKFLDQKFGLEENEELKGDEMFNGRKKWQKIELDTRVTYIEEIIDFIAKTKGSKLILANQSVTKENQHEKYFELLDAVIGKSSAITSKLGTTNRQLLVIFDEREDFKKDKKIYMRIAQNSKKIIEKYKKSCVVIDYGYEGISKFSRMLQIADFTAYFYRNYCSLVENPTLFEKAHDKRKVDFLNKIFKSALKKKCEFLKI